MDKESHGAGAYTSTDTKASPGRFILRKNSLLDGEEESFQPDYCSVEISCYLCMLRIFDHGFVGRTLERGPRHLSHRRV